MNWIAVVLFGSPVLIAVNGFALERMRRRRYAVRPSVHLRSRPMPLPRAARVLRRLAIPLLILSALAISMVGVMLGVTP